MQCSVEEQQEAEKLLQQTGEGGGGGEGGAAAAGGGGGAGGDLFRLVEVQEPLQQLLGKGMAAGWLATRNEVREAVRV